jgi:pyruvate formate lyase activating enzyme
VSAGEVVSPATDTALVGSVHSWDVALGVDGPGTRFALFTAGCPLRCAYCHNPDTWWGRSGMRMSVDDVLAEIAGYERFLRVAGGGVTVSGGEPLQQAAFVAALLRRCKERGLHTALDTCGYLGERADDALLDDTDLVLLDIKSWDRLTYRRLTDRELAPTLDFAERLAARGARTWVRFVLVPGMTDAVANVDGLARYVAGLGNVERVEVLPFHRLGDAKYAALGLPYPCEGVEPPSSALLRRVREQFGAHGLETH